jgi:hypothetical protein
MEAETIQQKSQLDEQSSVIKELEGTSSSAHQGTSNKRIIGKKLKFPKTSRAAESPCFRSRTPSRAGGEQGHGAGERVRRRQSQHENS